MPASRSYLAFAYWLLTAALFAAAVVLAFAYAPEEATMGPVQRIFYFHMPVAIGTFVSCMVVFIASIGYLWRRESHWDDLAHAAGIVAVLLCTIVLFTGSVWGKSAWGHWWAWTPRLTFSLVLWLLYIVYLMVRSSIESESRRAMVCAVYGLAAFLDVPLVWLSVRLMPQDLHPTSIQLDPAMKQTLLFWFVPVALLTAGLIRSRYCLARRQRQDRESRAAADHSTAP